MDADAPSDLKTADSKQADAKAKLEEALGYRELPHNAEAEQLLLGALLINNDFVNEIGDFLLADHFFEPIHQKIYAAIVKFHERGMLANPVTLKTFFAGDEALNALGGAQYLVKMAMGVSTAFANPKHYGKTIYDLALRRQLISLGEEVVQVAYESDVETPAISQIEQAEQKLFSLATEGRSERGFEHLTASLTAAIHSAGEAFKNKGRISGLTTGFRDLDRCLAGLQKSDLLILAGRPSMGKTALATNIAYKAAEAMLDKAGGDAKQAQCVGFFSLEMSGEQLASRLIAEASGVNGIKIKRGEIDQADLSKVIQASQHMNALPFFIDDTPALSISALRTRARRLQRLHNLGLIVVDYLQLMRSTSEAAKQNRVLEISEITQGLKAIAKELNIPVIALSQLSRAVEQREDKRPQLSDLRESGSIEQDADVVLFIFREEYYIARSMPREDTPEFTKWQEEMEKVHGIAEVIVAKQRHGPIDTVKLFFNASTTGFADLQRDEYTHTEF
ncbi:MAG: replicative DNA helicase [Alphaproteobacteria bacterium]|nr:replicative DNA helicase [Alphaproteobacteria bacterium]